MRNINKIVYLLIGFLLFFNHLILAQDFIAGDVITIQIDDYALIETNHAPISLTISSVVAGAAITSVSNSDMFLKLSSITGPGQKRKVTSRISSGSVPAGTILQVLAAKCTLTNSDGKLGRPRPAITLSFTDQDIIIGIETCYTGTGYNDGYQLTYSWIPTTAAADYALITSTTSAVNLIVVYTLTAFI